MTVQAKEPGPNAWWIARLTTLGFAPDVESITQSALDALTPQSLRAIASIYLDERRMTIGRLLPGTSPQVPESAHVVASARQ
ncbi:hypothetical protein [Silvimonas iriomotensis]|uniref:Uncharacterized protein n=1 Tax=Silvimonas iriomotensis TaxID=449662 RepID=A0ABQ2P5V0_9NEIS|nr:hypothetical protein [Silvimonas iriomotensis]GGP18887.1 hypothetical protein GCM10010970_07880 [Silvimonas iriomotensis]